MQISDPCLSIWKYLESFTVMTQLLNKKIEKTFRVKLLVPNKWLSNCISKYDFTVYVNPGLISRRGQTQCWCLCCHVSWHTLNNPHGSMHKFSSVQSLSRVRLFATPRIAALQASLSITNSQSSPRLASIESVMPSSHLTLGRLTVSLYWFARKGKTEL